jgi:uncharacterized protein
MYQRCAILRTNIRDFCTNMPCFSQLPILRPLLMILPLVLTACGTPPPAPGESPRVAEPSRVEATTPADLLLRANSMRGLEAALQKLQAAQLLHEAGENEAAEAVLNDLDFSAAAPSEQADFLLLRAEIASELEQPRLVLEILEPLEFPSLPALETGYRIRYHRLRAQAFQSIEAMLSSATERIQLDRFLTEAGQRNNHELIWEALGTIPVTQLQSLAGSAINYEVRGWYELALMARIHGSDLDRQVVELRRWLSNWARHPAATVLPDEMEQVEAMARERPRHVALLLPLDTPAGIIVRDAFMSAYFNLLELGGQVPEIRFYNTSVSPDILDLHRTAVLEGAELVIGPLLKENVAVLQSVANLQVPTLALNNVEGSTPASPLLFQFALSPEDEARQTANKAWRDGHRRIAVLRPRDEIRRSLNFITEWQNLGGEIAALEDFQDNYTDSISRMLELELSNDRHRSLNSLLGRQTVFQPRRRQDIDAIYLVAQTGPARQIVPSLSYLYAGNIPVYASQEIHSGLPRPVEDRDLNGVIFGESPWLLGQDDTSVSRTRELFPQTSAQTLRLQAFGIDAFRLYPRLKLLANLNNTAIPGASGMLRLSENQNIVRQLSWASIKDGLAVIGND